MKFRLNSKFAKAVLTAVAAFTVTLGFASASFAACPANAPLEFPQAGLCASFQWVQGPSTKVENSLNLQFVDAQTLAPKDPASAVKVALFMPDMGHGSRPTAITTLSTGLVQVTKMYFMMMGDWEVRVSVGDEQQVLPVTL